jgi:hypothetical protein
MACICVFEVFFGVFLAPSLARDPNNFLKTKYVFGFTHRVVKCELYSKK